MRFTDRVNVFRPRLAFALALSSALGHPTSVQADDVPDPVLLPISEYVYHIDDPAGTDPLVWLPEADVTWYGITPKVVDGLSNPNGIHGLILNYRNTGAVAVQFDVTTAVKQVGGGWAAATGTVTLDPGQTKFGDFYYDEQDLFGDDTGNLRVTVTMPAVPDDVEWGITVVESRCTLGPGVCPAESTASITTLPNPTPGQILVLVQNDDTIPAAPALSRMAGVALPVLLLAMGLWALARKLRRRRAVAR